MDLAIFYIGDVVARTHFAGSLADLIRNQVLIPVLTVGCLHEVTGSLWKVSYDFAARQVSSQS